MTIFSSFHQLGVILIVESSHVGAICCFVFHATRVAISMPTLVVTARLHKFRAATIEAYWGPTYGCHGLRCVLL